MIVAYARVSTDKQDAENQRFEIDRYLAAKGTPADKYVDEIVSGKAMVHERQLGILINELLPGDTLVVSEVSRISRRLGDIFATIQRLIDMRVKLIAVKQNYVFADDINSKVIAFAFGLAAEIERDLISSRTKEALARLKSEGKQLGRPPGTYQQHHYKLHGKETEIAGLVHSQVPIAALARHFDVNRETMRRFISDRELRSSRWTQTPV